MTQLAGQVALVTGAGSGIGRATAVLLAREGAKVGLLGRTREELETAQAEIAAAGGEGLVLTADISQMEEMETAVQQLITTWGRLDIVFANAGINGVWAPIYRLEVEEFRKTIDINLLGTFITIKCAAPHLKERGGAVVITSSVNGTRIFSNTGATAYSCSKAAQVTMAKMLALELAQDRIRVNVICPGAITTDIDESTDKQGVDEVKEPVIFPEGEIPLTDGRSGSAEQVADLVLFLVSGASSHISGTEVWIDGAQSLLQG
jgi:NAD(P)-dependent dehydrogenase (short-subunit alcohol dehydrogenase family)